MSTTEWLMSVTQIFYYILLLATTGFIFNRYLLSSGWNEQANGLAAKIEQRNTKMFIFAVIISLFFKVIHMTNQFGGNQDALVQILFETSSGRGWMILFIVSLLGLGTTKLNPSMKVLWACLLLFIESYNGHVLSASQSSIALLSDFVHLLCAAIWAGGVLTLLILWRERKEDVMMFAAAFTKLAWLSIVLLTISGIALTFTILSSWKYLFYTTWGQLLLIKTLIVIGVIVTGLSLRQRINQNKNISKKLLKIDFGLLAAIVIIVSVITVISPTPDSTPLYHHEMGEELHYTIEMTPNAPGPNHIDLTLWTLESEGKAENVKITLYASDRPERTLKEVNLAKTSQEAEIEFPGFVETHFELEELDLPYPGVWNIKLHITLENGTEQEVQFKFEN